MKRNILSLVLVFTAAALTAQQIPFRQTTLLDRRILDEIIGEASGETAYNHILEMGGYTRARTAAEYKGNLFEARYILDKIREYGLTGEIERFTDTVPTWNGISGEIWEISPGRKKLADYDDLRAMLVSGSSDADVEAELVWVDRGTKADLEKANVSGKIVVTSSDPGYVAGRMQGTGALGIISVSNWRPLVDPIQIPWSGFWGGRGSTQAFAFFMPPREGYPLRDRLLNGDKIKVHAKVKASWETTDLQVPTCVIPGTDPNAGEIIFSAHLFEGYLKQGGNDDLSGCAAILEVARMFNTLFSEGRLPRPARTMRFIFVPEFSGTIPWTAKHRDIIDKTLCNINLDMVGLWLSKGQSFLNLERTTYGNPHYLNDVMENFYRYVGETNRTMIHIWNGYRNRIVAPSGSDDPFYYNIETHFGGSDHEVFNDWGIGVPGIMMITWPDPYYHTSEDVADKCDPTQMKRVAVIAAAAAYTIAAADATAAGRIASDAFANGVRRIGIQSARALDELSEATAANLPGLYRKVRGYIAGCLINESETVESVTELAPADQALKASVAVQSAQLKAVADAQVAVIDQEMKNLSVRLGIPAVALKADKTEKEALGMIPDKTAKVRENGFGGFGQFDPVPSAEQAVLFEQGLSDRHELNRLCNGKHNALQIKQMLDAQSAKESDLAAVMDYIRLLEKNGLVTLKKP